jgi:inner membrane protein YidH
MLTHICLYMNMSVMGSPGTGHTSSAGNGQPDPAAAAPAGETAAAPAGETPAAPAAAEHEPDARFTFANERTFLAWSRTALALVVGGLAVAQLLPPFPGVPGARHAIGIPLILLGAAIAVLSYAEWQASQRALRRGQPLPRSRLPLFLAGTIGVIALLAAALALLSAVTGHQ